MSIDFSKITGWRDQYGVVTQIADASGRVIWSANTFDGIIYLRPSADISVDETFTLTPSDATAAYMLINEEVSDGEATTIGVSGSGVTGGDAIFELAGNVPTKISRVTNIYIVVSVDSTDNTYKGTWIGPYLIIDDTSKYRFTEFGGDYDVGVQLAYEPQECYVWSEAAMETGYYIKGVTTEELVAKINEYVLANAQLPNIKLGVAMYADGEENESGKSEDGTLWLSQAYVVIECE